MDNLPIILHFFLVTVKLNGILICSTIMISLQKIAKIKITAQAHFTISLVFFTLSAPLWYELVVFFLLECLCLIALPEFVISLLHNTYFYHLFPSVLIPLRTERKSKNLLARISSTNILTNSSYPFQTRKVFKTKWIHTVPCRINLKL